MVAKYCHNFFSKKAIANTVVKNGHQNSYQCGSQNCRQKLFTKKKKKNTKNTTEKYPLASTPQASRPTRFASGPREEPARILATWPPLPATCPQPTRVFAGGQDLSTSQYPSGSQRTHLCPPIAWVFTHFPLFPKRQILQKNTIVF